MSNLPFFLDIPKHANPVRDAARAAFADASPAKRGAAEIAEPGRFERLVSERLAQPQRDERESGASDQADDAQKSTGARERDDQTRDPVEHRVESRTEPAKDGREQPERPEAPPEPDRSDESRDSRAPQREDDAASVDAEVAAASVQSEPAPAVATDGSSQVEARTDRVEPEAQPVSETSRPDQRISESTPSDRAPTESAPASTRPDATTDAPQRPESREAANPERTLRHTAPAHTGEGRAERPQGEQSPERIAGRAERAGRQESEHRPSSSANAHGAAASNSARADTATAAQPVAPSSQPPADAQSAREAPRFEQSEYRVAESMRESGGERRSDAESNPDRDDRSRADARAAAAAAANAADRAAGARSSVFVEMMDASRAQVRSAAAPTQGANGAGAPSATAAPTLGAAPPSGGAELSEADQRAFQASVSRGLGAAVRQRGGVMTLRLNPASLGTMRIEMSIRQGAVSARIEASTQQAQQLLMRNMTQLRSALEGRGLSVERVQVTVTPAPSGGPASESGQQDAQPGSQDRSSRQDAGDGQSRGAFDRREDRGAGGSGAHDNDGSGPEGLSGEQREPGFHGRLRLRLNAVA